LAHAGDLGAGAGLEDGYGVLDAFDVMVVLLGPSAPVIRFRLRPE
jgi:hypothetical protein